MKIVIDSMLRISDAPKDFAKWLKDSLTMKNPEFQKMKAIGRPVWGIARELKEYTEQDGVITVPRGFAKNIQEYLATVPPIFVEWIDNRTIAPVDFHTHPNLREYQAPVKRHAREYSQGIVIAPCGAGKTQMGLAISAELGQQTLWITHTMDLLKQSMDRAISCLGLSGREIGLIQAENMTIGTHITFATVQTLSRRDIGMLAGVFGTVIVDECHLVYKNGEAARMFADVVGKLPSLYRFGLTASEFRADGLIDTMYHVMGPKIYEVSQSALDDAGYVVHPEIRYRESSFYFEMPESDDGEKDPLNCQMMLQAMRQDEARNRLIKDAIIECAGYPTIVLADSLEHLQELSSWTATVCGANCVFVNGTTNKKKREKAIADMRDGRADILFATYQLAKLGLDIPRLSRLIMATPKRDKTSVQQAVGRIMRPDDGKPKPMVYDILDNSISTLKYWAGARRKVYKQLGAEFEAQPKRKAGTNR